MWKGSFEYVLQEDAAADVERWRDWFDRDEACKELLKAGAEKDIVEIWRGSGFSAENPCSPGGHTGKVLMKAVAG